MCIENDDCVVVKNGPLKLWKVIRKDNQIGLWANTGWRRRNIIKIVKEYRLGVNIAKSFSILRLSHPTTNPGQFHCFFTRKAARRYTKNRYGQCSVFLKIKSKRTKIIRVYANSSDVVKIGWDGNSGIRAISVSKMTIKSLKHQR